MYICDEGVAEKQMADTYEKAVAAEGTENATGNSSEVRRFFGAQGETSPSKYPPKRTKSPNYSVSFPHVLCYTLHSYEYGKFES